MDEKQTKKAVALFYDLVGLFDTKPRAFVTVAMIIAIIALAFDLRRVYNIRAEDSEARLKRSEDFIYNRVLERVNDNVEPRLSQVEANTDSARAIVDSTAQQIQPVLKKIS